MADINALIAQGIRPPQIDDPLNKLAQVMQIQGLQRQGQMHDMDLQQRRQGIERQNRLSQLLGGFQQGMTPDEQAGALTQGGFLSEAQTVTKTAAESSKAKREAEKAELENWMKKIELGGQILSSVKDPVSYQRAAQVAQQAGFGAWPEQYDPAWVQQQKQQGRTLKDQADDEWKARQDETTRRGQDMTDARMRDQTAATKDQAAATREAAKMRDARDTELKLSDDYRAQSKDFKDVSNAYSQINKTLDKATTSPAATLAAATKFMKLLDPGSVVRESELGMALAASGVIDRAFNYYNVLASGKVLTKQQAEDFKNITGQIYQAAQQEQQKIDADYRQRAQAYGLNPDRVIQNLGQSAPSGAPAVGAVQDGYRFKGGNPADPKSWEKL